MLHSNRYSSYPAAQHVSFGSSQHFALEYLLTGRSKKQLSNRKILAGFRKKEIEFWLLPREMAAPSHRIGAIRSGQKLAAMRK